MPGQQAMSDLHVGRRERRLGRHGKDGNPAVRGHHGAGPQRHRRRSVPRRTARSRYQLGNLYRPGLPHGLTCGAGCARVAVRDRSSPGLMATNGPANRGPACADGRVLLFPVLLDSCQPLGPGRPCQGSRSDRARLGLDVADSAETIEQRGGRQHQLEGTRLWLPAKVSRLGGGYFTDDRTTSTQDAQ